MTIKLQSQYLLNVSKFAPAYLDGSDPATQNAQAHEMDANPEWTQQAVADCWDSCPIAQRNALADYYGYLYRGFNPALSYASNIA